VSGGGVYTDSVGASVGAAVGAAVGASLVSSASPSRLLLVGGGVYTFSPSPFGVTGGLAVGEGVGASVMAAVSVTTKTRF